MKVRIYRVHTHNRVTYRPGPAGLLLAVSPAEAEFLKQHGVLDPPTPKATPVVDVADQAEQPTA